MHVITNDNKTFFDMTSKAGSNEVSQDNVFAGNLLCKLLITQSNFLEYHAFQILLIFVDKCSCWSDIHALFYPLFCSSWMIGVL